jgi:predicted nuclease of predicted toxin-antitoxin system
MKILLDAHISGRTVGKVLAEGGHDVRALDSEPELEALSDPEVLELAAEEGRILVTANIRDFEPLLREWAGEGRPHAGVNLVPSSVRNEAFGVLISSVEETHAGFAQEEWVDGARKGQPAHGHKPPLRQPCDLHPRAGRGLGRLLRGRPQAGRFPRRAGRPRGDHRSTSQPGVRRTRDRAAGAHGRRVTGDSRKEKGRLMGTISVRIHLYGLVFSVLH